MLADCMCMITHTHGRLGLDPSQKKTLYCPGQLAVNPGD
jgi:hypothetical protein